MCKNCWNPHPKRAEIKEFKTINLNFQIITPDKTFLNLK